MKLFRNLAPALGLFIAIVFSASPLFAQTVTAPLFKHRNGSAAEAMGFFCLNPADNTSCTFGGGGALNVQANASAPSATEGQTGFNLSTDLLRHLRVIDDQGHTDMQSLLSLAGQASPAQTSHQVNIGAVEGLAGGSSPIAINGASAGTVLVTHSGTTVIQVTQEHLVASAVGTFALVYGTGTNCATGLTYLEGSAAVPPTFAANGGQSVGNGFGVLYTVPANNDLCAVTTTSASALFAGAVSWIRN